jgi:hypothetical protein
MKIKIKKTKNDNEIIDFIAKGLLKQKNIFLFNGNSELTDEPCFSRNLLVAKNLPACRSELQSFFGIESWKYYKILLLKESYETFYKNKKFLEYGMSTSNLVISKEDKSRDNFFEEINEHKNSIELDYHHFNLEDRIVVVDKHEKIVYNIMKKIKEENDIDFLYTIPLKYKDEPVIETPKQCFELYKKIVLKHERESMKNWFYLVIDNNIIKG